MDETTRQSTREPLDPCRYLVCRNPGRARWAVAERDGVLEVHYGTGGGLPQYAALHLDSGYFRLASGPGTAWGTSVVVVPTVWPLGACGPVQGAPVTVLSAAEEGERLRVSFAAGIAGPRVSGEIRLLPPGLGATLALVSVTADGDLPLETRRPWDMFKPVMLSSMRVSPDLWDASAAFAGGAVLDVPQDGWIAEPPVPASSFGLHGGNSGWQRNRGPGPSPAVEVILGRSMPVTGWVTPDDDPDHDNVALWACSSHVLASWSYRLVAKAAREIRPAPAPGPRPQAEVR